MIYIKQITSKKNTYEVVVKEIYKSSSGGSGNSKSSGSGNFDCIGFCQGTFTSIIIHCERNAICNNNIINLNQQLVAVSGGKIDSNALQLASMGAITLAAANSPTGDIASATISEEESRNLLKNVNGNLEPLVPITPGGPTPTGSTASLVTTSPEVSGAVTPTPPEGTTGTTASTPLVVAGLALPPPDDTTTPPTTDDTTTPEPLVVSGVSLPPPEDDNNAPDTETLSTAEEDEDNGAQPTSESKGDNNGIDFGDDDIFSDGGDSGDDGGDSGGGEE